MRLPVKLGVGERECTVMLLRVADDGVLLCATPPLAILTPVSLTLGAGQPDELVITGTVARRIGSDALLIEVEPDNALSARFRSPSVTQISAPALAAKPTRRMMRPVLSSLQRVCERGEHDGKEPILSGVVDDVGIPALLSWLEQTERSGRLEVTRGEHAITIDFERGKVVDVRSSTLAGSCRDLLFGALGWGDGTYALRSRVRTARGRGLSITQLLIAHAGEHDAPQTADDAERTSSGARELEVALLDE